MMPMSSRGFLAYAERLRDDAKAAAMLGHLERAHELKKLATHIVTANRIVPEHRPLVLYPGDEGYNDG